MNNYTIYKNSFDKLIIYDIQLNNFLQKRDKFVNFDSIVKVINDFDRRLEALQGSDILDEFGKDIYFDIKELNETFKLKRELIERFKARQATNLNSIHYVYELNQYFDESSDLNSDIKLKINNTLFMIMQYFVGLNEDKSQIIQNLAQIEKYNERNFSKRFELLVIHTAKILENIDYLNELKKASEDLNLQRRLYTAHNLLVLKYEQKLFFQLLISVFFFISVILMIIVIYREHKKSQKIRNELSAFKYAVENSDNSVVLTDANKRILYVNDIFEKNTGFTKEEASGNKPKMLKSGETPEKTYDDLNKKLTAGEKWEGEFINKRKDGSIFYEKASIVPIFIDEELTNYLAIKLDVTKYIKQSERLKLSSIAFDNIQEGILICDSSKKIITSNKAFEEILGYKKEEITGKRPSMFNSGYHDRSFYKHMTTSLLQTGSWKGKIYNKRKDGEVIPFWLNISVVRDKNGEVSKYVAVHTSLKDIIDSQQKADFLAYHDSLTKLPNRTKLEEDLTNALSRANRNDLSIFVLFIDLDRFKIINDTLGHSVGDKLLINISKKIKAVLRDTDFIARMGGDEFIVVLESCKNKKAAGYVCEKILDIVKEPIEIENSILNTSASIGVAMFPDDGFDMTTLIKNADTAMYHAKKLGKDNYQYYDTQLSLDVHEQLQIEQSLKEALANDEFFLNYQPQYCLDSKKIVAFEALIRWEHPLFGFISPAKFIPIAEDTGDIIEIGKYVFDKACKDFIDFRRVNPKLEYIAINISAIQFKDKNFLNEVISIINKYELSPSEIELEITERYIMDFTENNMNIVLKLRKLGFRFSVDDFGTGYSSLSYLTKFPFDVLKVDKAFVDGTPNDSSNVKISKGIIALAKSLGYKVIAEGIEYEEQEEFLKSVDCDMGQGYLFSKPLKYDDIIDLLKR